MRRRPLKDLISRKKRGAIGLLLCFLTPQVCEYAVLVLPYSVWATRACASRPVPEETPNASEEVQAYVSALKRKWGIDENATVEVLCTCKCCGDRCPMGAECCCPSEKIPFETNRGLFLAGYRVFRFRDLGLRSSG